jgi:ABC-type phosphate transport system substrate-binding protein
MACAAILLLAMCSCGKGEENGASSPTLAIAADHSANVLAGDLLNAYEDTHSNTTMLLEQGSRDSALSAVLESRVDAAIIWYPPDDRRLFSTPIGNDLLVIVGHPDSSVDSLSTNELRTVFSGHVVTWADFGEPQPTVQVVSREAGSSSRLAFEEWVLQGVSMSPSARLGVNDQLVIEYVSTIPGSIGYVPLSQLDHRVIPIAVDGVAPTRAEGRRRAYALTVPVGFVARQEPQGQLRRFLSWIVEEEGQQVVHRTMLGFDE